MKDCLSTDAIVAIGEALDWNVMEGLHHLHSCEECRAQLETLKLAHSVLVETETVDADVLQRVTAAVNAAAAKEQRQAQRPERRALWWEAILAGVTALIVLVSSGVTIESPAAVALGFTLGAALLVSGRWLAHGWPAFRQGGAHV
jgi:cation transport ATPase